MTYDLFENPLVLAKHAAEREMRDAFQDKYGSFWKCVTCGKNLGNLDAPTRCCVETAPMGGKFLYTAQLCGYSGALRRLETIAAAAILIDGKVWSVPPPGRHHNVICLYVFDSPVHPPAEGAQELRRYVGKLEAQGFLTSTGRFVDRKEGLRIAVAVGQYRNPASSEARHRVGPSPVSDELYSEDVW